MPVFGQGDLRVVGDISRGRTGDLSKAPTKHFKSQSVFVFFSHHIRHGAAPGARGNVLRI